jgi:DNA-binding IclR family transcriptional regulator
MNATHTDLLTGDLGFDAVVMLTVLTDGYYSLSVLADEAGLPVSKASAALRYLVNAGRVVRHPLHGYAIKAA